MFVYQYSREFGDTVHSNPDTYNIDHEEEITPIGDRISTDLPGKTFVVRCSGTSLDIEFDQTLTGEEQITLNNTITTHKAVDDWPPA